MAIPEAYSEIIDKKRGQATFLSAQIPYPPGCRRDDSAPEDAHGRCSLDEDLLNAAAQPFASNLTDPERRLVAAHSGSVYRVLLPVEAGTETYHYILVFTVPRQK